MATDRFESQETQDDIADLTNTQILNNVVVNNTDRSAAVTEVSSLLVYNPYLKMGIVNIRFLITSATPTSGLCLGNWAPTYVPVGIRPTVPVIRDSDGGVEGSLYANMASGTNTKIMVYNISSTSGYHIAQFPVILN